MSEEVVSQTPEAVKAPEVQTPAPAQEDNQLSLWQFSNRELSVNLMRFTTGTYKRSDNGSERVKIMASKRKDIAKLSGLTGKGNAQALDRKILQVKDDLKEKLGQEMVGYIKDENYTGGSMVVTRSAKTGLRKVSFTFDELPEGARGASDEEIAKALGWTIEQVRAARKRQQEAIDKAEVETQGTVVTSEPARKPMTEAEIADQQAQAELEAEEAARKATESK